ncbi:MAG: xylulokinase [Anaerolineae bacterium]|nr:xylulokinase [Anaerolineae bacterium]
MPYLLGIDVGTSGTKVLILDEAGAVVANVTEEYPLDTPRPLWSEQNPHDWWAATTAGIQRALASAGLTGDDIGGVGLSGQMHGMVMLDRDARPLRPAILWNDQRTGPQCQWITERVGFQRLLDLTANAVLPGFTAPKIVWTRENEPAVYERTAKILLPKDYVRYRLTGEYASEVSDASGTSLFDVRRRAWSDAMLTALDIPRDWLPDVFESPVVSGQISPTAAQATGLRPGTPVVGGGGDQAAGAVGSGIVEPGLVSVTVGTSGVVFAHLDEFALEPQGRLHAFCHAVPGKWHVMGVTLSAGGSLRWLRDALGQDEVAVARLMGVDPYELLDAEAARAPAGSEGLLFLPYLSGERTPYPDPHAKGVFVGLTLRHGKPHLTRSVLEGVAYSLRDCLELVRDLGLAVQQVRASGGGARSPLWREIQADVFGTELVTINVAEGAAYGAALLAGVGIGVYTSVEEAAARVIRVVTRTAPSADAPRYAPGYAIYRQLYPSLRPTFEALNRWVVDAGH